MPSGKGIPPLPVKAASPRSTAWIWILASSLIGLVAVAGVMLVWFSGIPSRGPITPGGPNTPGGSSTPGGGASGVSQFKGSEGKITGLALADDGKRLLTAGSDGTIRVWEALGGVEVRALPPQPGRTTSVAISKDGRHGVTSHGGTVIAGGEIAVSPENHVAILWNLDEGRIVHRFVGHERDVQAVVFSPDERQILTTSWDGTARVWDVNDARMISQFGGHRVPVYAAAFSPDGLRALTGGLDGSVHLWFTQSGRGIRRMIGHKGCVNGLAFTQTSGKAMTVSADTSVRLWDVESGNEVKQFKGHTSWVNSVSIIPGDKKALTSSGGEFQNEAVIESDDNSVCLWNLETGDLIQRFSGHTKPVGRVAVFPDGLRCLSGGADGQVRQWKLP